ncbi:translation elongation factor 4, partial [Candidatus Gracilibacteria bacterium]|nr:translation elongation factor 4 [Candidatus Gracilibacteria bacterium]
WTYTGDKPEFKGERFILNLIDTPGHVDFAYEVSRSIAACEGAILVVDATQGIQAQTLSNCYLAIDHNLTMIPVINKIDLPASDPEKVIKEIENTIGIGGDEVIAISAKNGTNVDAVLNAIIERVPPPPETEEGGELKALIFDSTYDTYKGIVTYVRVMSGEAKRDDKVYFLHNGLEVNILEVGFFKPKYKPSEKISAGEIGYIITGVKEVSDARVGDTVWARGTTKKTIEEATPLPGYKIVKPFVFASVFCVDGDDFPLLRDALEKLKLNDSSLVYEPEQSGALGNGFRCGFLGLLHLDIVQERLEREYNLNLVVTAPSVSYKVRHSNNIEEIISNPADLPDPSRIDALLEPWMKVELVTPKEYLGGILSLVQDKRGIQKNIQYIDEVRVIVTAEIPLASIVIDFYDKLKSATAGYASMNYEFIDYREGDLVKMDILVAAEKVEALSMMLHRKEAQSMGQSMTKKLKDLIPRMQFEIAIQAAIGGKIIARETISAMRKDVTAKLYGGDRTRKDKLLKKQKEGKKRMKMVGRVEIPQEAFLAILKKD